LVRSGVMANTQTKVLAATGTAASVVEKTAPKWIEPIVVAGQKTGLSPRRAVKTVSKIVQGVSTQATLNASAAPGAVTPQYKLPQRAPWRNPVEAIYPKVQLQSPTQVITPASKRGRSAVQRPPAMRGPSQLPRSKAQSPQLGSLRWIGRGLSEPPARPVPGRPRQGFLRWLGQGLDSRSPGGKPLIRPAPFPAQAPFPPLPRPGSLAWMGRGLSQPPVRPIPLRPAPGSLAWMGQGLRRGR
jgi:hypothetical protein